MLESNGTYWTPAPDLARISLQYCRVIAALRARGFEIQNRVETVDGQRRGFYRLIGRSAISLPQTFDSSSGLLPFPEAIPARYADPEEA